jgi:hypothetical protein
VIQLSEMPWDAHGNALMRTCPLLALCGIGIYTSAFQRHLSMPEHPSPCPLPSRARGERVAEGRVRGAFGNRRVAATGGCEARPLAQRRRRLEISSENDFLAGVCRYQCHVWRGGRVAEDI